MSSSKWKFSNLSLSIWHSNCLHFCKNWEQTLCTINFKLWRKPKMDDFFHSLFIGLYLFSCSLQNFAVSSIASNNVVPKGFRVTWFLSTVCKWNGIQIKAWAMLSMGTFLMQFIEYQNFFFVPLPMKKEPKDVYAHARILPGSVVSSLAPIFSSLLSVFHYINLPSLIYFS